ncbi:MAG: pyridoxal phosphate-dependent aminotransferase [Candidatus Levyibacteriota bacterium]
MKFPHANRLDQFPEYVFSKLDKLIVEVEKTSGKKVLNVGVGSPDIPPSKIYLEKLHSYIMEPTAHKYPGYGPLPEFRVAVIGWYQKRFGVSLNNDEVYQLNGAKDAISLLPLAFLNADDEVLLPDPGYQGYLGPQLLAGAKPLFYTLSDDPDQLIDLNALERLVTPKTKCMWLNFPSNPTGQVITLSELKRIVEFAHAHTIFLIYDNAYSEITFDGYVAPSILQIPDAKEVAVEINSFSKSHYFAGYRIGWIAGNAAIIASLAKLKSHMDSGLSIPLQKVGAYMLTNPDTVWHTNILATYAERRQEVGNFLSHLKLEFSLPKGGLYIWAKIPTNETNVWDYCMQLLQQKNILLTPGTAFGSNGKNYVRASFCGNVTKINDYI